jgi:hypothetical protein
MAATSATTRAIEPPPTLASASANAPQTAPSATAAPEAKAKGPAKPDAQGFSGLGLAGIGENGDGRGEGICLCGVGSIGLSKTEQKRGKPAQIRLGAVTVNGKDLPPEVVFRVVRNASARFLSCYQRGLNANPHLEGRIVANLVIDEAGATATNKDGESDVPDADVVVCVRDELGKLHFPARKAGSIATVVLPLELRAPAAP